MSATTQKEPEKPVLSEKESAELSTQIVEGLWGEKPKAEPKKEEKKEPEKAAETPPETDKTEKTEKKEEKVEDPPKPASTEKPRPKAGAPATRKEEPKGTDDGEKAREQARLIAEELSKKKPAEQPEKAVELEKSDARDLEVISFLEKSNPKKYSEFAKKTEEFFKEVLYPYKKKWLKENPGKSFDPDDAEHEAIYEKQPEIDPEDFEEAKVEWRAEKKADELIQKRVQPKLDEIEQKEVERDVNPRIEKHSKVAVDTLLEVADAEFKGLTIEKVREKDPLAANILQEAAEPLKVLVSELEKLSEARLKYRFNPDNDAHVALRNFAMSYEDELSNMPQEEQLWNGKRFARQRDFAAMNPAEQARHWTISGGDLRDVLIQRYADNIKTKLEAQRELAAKSLESRGWKRVDAALKQTPKKEDGEDGEGNENRPKPRPPSTASSSDKVNSGKETSAPVGDLTDVIVKGMF